MGARSTFGASLILVINLLALLLAGVGQLVLLGECAGNGTWPSRRQYMPLNIWEGARMVALFLTTWALAGLGLWIELRRIQGPGAKGMRYAVGNWEQHYQLAFVGPCLMVLGFLEGSHAVEGVDGFPNAAIAILFLVGFLDSFVCLCLGHPPLSVLLRVEFRGSEPLLIKSTRANSPRRLPKREQLRPDSYAPAVHTGVRSPNPQSAGTWLPSWVSAAWTGASTFVAPPETATVTTHQPLIPSSRAGTPRASTPPLSRSEHRRLPYQQPTPPSRVRSHHSMRTASIGRAEDVLPPYLESDTEWSSWGADEDDASTIMPGVRTRATTPATSVAPSEAPRGYFDTFASKWG